MIPLLDNLPIAVVFHFPNDLFMSSFSKAKKVYKVRLFLLIFSSSFFFAFSLSLISFVLQSLKSNSRSMAISNDFFFLYLKYNIDLFGSIWSLNLSSLTALNVSIFKTPFNIVATFSTVNHNSKRKGLAIYRFTFSIRSRNGQKHSINWCRGTKQKKGPLWKAVENSPLDHFLTWTLQNWLHDITQNVLCSSHILEK